jgi:CubicO group peptidase (beta-lactamase class C family)
MQPVNTSAEHQGARYPISGYCDPRFNKVLERFAANFAEGAEDGACVSVTLDGKPVVDLWGGFADRAHTKPWQRDTIVNMMSVSKAASAVCMHMLIDRGLIDMEAPVAKYWPEFAQAGKEKLPVKYVLDHRSGLALVPEVKYGAIADWKWMTEALARQAPIWPYGEVAAYHGLTQGFILGEIVRRVSGKSLGTMFREEVAKPLGLDYHIGLKPDEEARVAEYIPDALINGFRVKEPVDPKNLNPYVWAQLAADEDFNTKEWHRAEIPSANGHGTARAIARLYAMLVNGGELDGVRIMSAAAVKRMTTEQHNLTEVLRGRAYHQASGVLLNTPPYVYMGPNPHAFGHHGAGGSIGIGDPDAKVGFGYGTNRMHADPTNGPRGGGLIKATFESL